MEESKLQALADSLSKHSGRKGLGTYSGEYSWSKTANSSTTTESSRNDGLPTNPLYNNFVREGTYDPSKKTPLDHGDGRLIKRDFSDIPAIVDETSSDDKSKNSSKKTKEERKAEKKALKKAAKRAAKLEAKKKAKLEEKKKAKLEEKRWLKKMAKTGKPDNT